MIFSSQLQKLKKSILNVPKTKKIVNVLLEKRVLNIMILLFVFLFGKIKLQEKEILMK